MGIRYQRFLPLYGSLSKILLKSKLVCKGCTFENSKILNFPFRPSYVAPVANFVWKCLLARQNVDLLQKPKWEQIASFLSHWGWSRYSGRFIWHKKQQQHYIFDSFIFRLVKNTGFGAKTRVQQFSKNTGLDRFDFSFSKSFEEIQSWSASQTVSGISYLQSLVSTAR